MKSKASIKGHSIHPMLVSFPIAFFTGTFILDLLAFFSGNESFSQAATYTEVGGIISAVAAAIPGIIDYTYTVTPHSTAKKRGLQHGLLNGTMLLIFITALVFKFSTDISLPVIIALEGAGVALITFTGWLGGTLVSRNQIGIDHRYANAGKWN